MSDRRKPVETVIPPASEDKIEVANKVTLCPGTEFERTILLDIPRGREGRKMTARLLPMMERLTGMLSGGVNEDNFSSFVTVVRELWGDEKFEDEIFPFVLGLKPDDPILDHMGLEHSR